MTAVLLAPCAFCGAGPTQLHHPTCRLGPNLPYLDPGLRIVVCSAGSVRNHHDRVGEALRDLGLDFLPVGTDPLAYRVKLVAIHAGLFADAGKPFTLADAAASRALQGLLLEVVEVLGYREVAA